MGNSLLTEVGLFLTDVHRKVSFFLVFFFPSSFTSRDMMVFDRFSSWFSNDKGD